VKAQESKTDFSYAQVIPIFISIAIYFSVVYFLQLYENASVENNPHPDSSTYLNGARLLFQVGFTPEKHRPIGISLILGLPYLFNCSEVVIKFYILFLQFLCWVGMHLLIYQMVKKWIRKEIAIWVIPVYTIFISPLFYTFFILSDTVFSFFILLAVFYLQKYFINPHGKYFTIFCTIIFYSALIKPVIYYFAIFVFIAVIILYITKILKSPEFRFIHTVLIIFAFIFTIGLQLGLMYNHFGVMSPTLQNERAKYYMIFMAESIEKDENPALTRDNFDKIIDYTMKNNQNTWEKVVNQKFDSMLKFKKYYLMRGYFSSLKSNLTESSNIESTLKNYRESSNFTTYTRLADFVTGWENKLQTFLFILNGIIICVIIIKRKVIETSIWFPTVIVSFILCTYLYFLSGVVFWGEGRYSLPQFPINIFILVVLLSKFRSTVKALS